MVKQWIVAWLCFSLSGVPAAFAETGTPPAAAASAAAISTLSGLPGGGAEFVLGNYPGAVLMPVKIWGAVGKNGIAYVPRNTTLLNLIFLAGGPTQSADMDKVTIKRTNGHVESVINVDAMALVVEPNVVSPVLEPNDIITFPAKTPLISPDLTAFMSSTAAVLGFVVLIMAFKERL